MSLKKKVALAVSTVFLATSILSACSNNTESNVDSKSKGQEEKVTIKYYIWDKEVMQASTDKYIKQFEKENPNIKVEHVSLVPGNSLETLKKLDVLMASGEPIDLFMTPHIDAIYQRAAQGVVEPLDDLYKENKLNPVIDWSKASQEALIAAMSPCAAASSYPVVPLICPAW